MKKGFTLVEIMIVVSIIALLAAISIPLMLRNQITASETLAISSCRIIVSACQSYYSVALPHTYPADLQTLGSIGSNPPYLDDALATPPYQRSGYLYTYNFITPVSFSLNADPIYPGRTGNRYFYTDETGKITAKEGGQAGPADPAIE